MYTDTLSLYKTKRLGLALFLLLIAMLFSGIGINHLSYLSTTLALIAFFPFLQLRRKARYDKKCLFLMNIILLFNVYLFLQMFVTETNQSLVTILLSPNFLQAILVFSFIYFDECYLPVIINQIKKYLPLIVVLIPFSTALAITVVFILFVFREMIIRKAWIRWLFWLLLVVYAYYLFAGGIRFHGIAILFVFALNIAVEFFPKLVKLEWLSVISMPFVFAVSLFLFDISLFDVSDSSDSELMADSRTLLYIEAPESLKRQNSLWFGVGILGGVASDALLKYDKTVGSDGKRQFIETNILDLMRRGGLMYMTLYFLLYGVVSYRALKAKNIYIKRMGLIIATTFFFSLIDIPVFMECVTITYFLLLGFVSNLKLRELLDCQFVKWLKSNVIG